jgi:DNA-binding response OmpR family regulator
MLPERREIATVVVCEDDEATLELLCDHLTADRFEVLPAPCASDALRLASYNHPDLMVLDLGLPDAGGLDVLREIREADGVAARFDPSLPVIVVSGRGSGDDRVRGMESGADDYLVNSELSLFAGTRPCLRSSGRSASSTPAIASGRTSGRILHFAALNGSAPSSGWSARIDR